MFNNILICINMYINFTKEVILHDVITFRYFQQFSLIACTVSLLPKVA